MGIITSTVRVGQKPPKEVIKRIKKKRSVTIRIAPDILKCMPKDLLPGVLWPVSLSEMYA